MYSIDKSCPLVKICYEFTRPDGSGAFGAEGITSGEDGNRQYFMCRGCYFFDNGLIPEIYDIWEKHTHYPFGSLQHALNTYGLAQELYKELTKGD